VGSAVRSQTSGDTMQQTATYGCSPSQSLSQSSRVKNAIAASVPIQESERFTRALLSDTDASNIDTEALNDPKTSVATSRHSDTATSAVVSKIKAQYPSPPRLKERALNFMCPCCCTPLQKRDYNMRGWRSVSNLIPPSKFTLTYTKGNTSEAIFIHIPVF
jgi:hypothetical protein